MGRCCSARGRRRCRSLPCQVHGGREAVAEAERFRWTHKAIKGVDRHGERCHALNPEAYAEWRQFGLVRTICQRTSKDSGRTSTTSSRTGSRTTPR
ncbi:oxygenase MpaB family protein [Amycolatopsis sp. QT-25]|nr:oxygenase MpaB family protein [Amycolatopsis sp. QT-25]WET83436.1 oxygenase MpaB family protein [Amycolatopsis sp. QT-25]